MSEESRVPKSIVDELNKLGKQLSSAIQMAWESEDRKKLEAEISEGLQKLGEQITDATKKASDSDAAKQIKVQAEKVVVEVKESDVVEEVRKGLIAGLEVVNKELGSSWSAW